MVAVTSFEDTTRLNYDIRIGYLANRDLPIIFFHLNNSELLETGWKMCWTELPTYIVGDKDISIAHPSSLEVMKYLTDNLHNFVVVIVIVVVVAGKGVVHPLTSGLGHSR